MGFNHGHFSIEFFFLKCKKYGDKVEMSPDTVIHIGQESLRITALLAAPVLLTALGVGLVIGMIQAATQIQEMTLSFIPKLLGVVIALAVSGMWMLQLLADFTERLFLSIPDLIG